MIGSYEQLEDKAKSQNAGMQVLFTIAKEKLINSWKYGMTVLLLDVLQVIAKPAFAGVWQRAQSMLCSLISKLLTAFTLSS